MEGKFVVDGEFDTEGLIDKVGKSDGDDDSLFDVKVFVSLYSNAPPPIK